jgi:hypothetical protein
MAAQNKTTVKGYFETGDVPTEAQFIELIDSYQDYRAALLSSPASDPTGITGADAVTNIVSLTQAEYDAIGSPNASTFYIITDAT